VLSATILSIIGLGVFIFLLVRLSPKHVRIHKNLPKVTIIIPARNEAHRITPTLLSLKPYLNVHQIIIVDDHSTDDTKDVCQSLGFEVLTPQPKPSHIKGKPWALSQGALHAINDILITLDADVIVSNQGIEKMISLYLDALYPISIQPYHRMKKPYERLANIFNLLVVMASSSYTLIPSKTISAFFGPCQIMDKKTFLSFGTDTSVTSQVLEDIYLGKALLKGGHNISSVIGKGIIDFRMYPSGILDMLGGFSKNFATGAIAIGFIPALLLITWLSSLYATMNMMIQTFIFQEQYLLSTILYVLHGILIYLKSRHIGNFTIFIIVLYPIHAMFFLLTFIWSYIKIYIIKRNSWKGRRV